MNRNLSSTRFDRVFINLELLGKIMAIRMTQRDYVKNSLPLSITKTEYPDGTTIYR